MFDPAILDAMRADLRFVSPALEREGWSREEIGEVSAIVKVHLASGNNNGLVATAAWLRQRAGHRLAELQAEHAKRRAQEASEWHDEASVRALNREWMRTRGKR